MSTTIIKLKSKHKPLQVINPAGDLFESFAAYKGMEGEVFLISEMKPLTSLVSAISMTILKRNP